MSPGGWTCAICAALRPKPALVAAASLDFVCFSLAVRFHFRSDGSMPPGMRNLSVFSIACFAAFLTLLHGAASPRPARAAAALCLFAAALSVFCWSIRTTRERPPLLAFADGTPARVTTSGPYRYVRHPFYSSYIAFWCGTGVASGSVFGWIGPAIVSMVYLRAASREERDFASSASASAYRSFKAKTGMLLPKVPGVRRRAGVLAGIAVLRRAAR